MIQNRSIGMCIFLSIITCGIYGIYWYYCILTDLYTAANLPNNAGVDILLSIITCGIYGIYIYYKMGTLSNTARMIYGLPPKDESVLYLVLGIFGLGIIVYCLIQNELNETLSYVVNNNVVYDAPNANQVPYQTPPSAPNNSDSSYGYQDDFENTYNDNNDTDNEL